jgi:hypothetical protein
MSKIGLEERILSQVKTEVQYWLSIEGEIKDAYEYETKYESVARKITQKILQETMGNLPTSRNGKKKF